MKTSTLLLATGISLVLICLTSVSGPKHPVPQNNFQMPILRLKTPESLREYEPLIREAADHIGWDWRLVASVIYHESRFDNNAQSSKGATGLMQIRSSRYSEDTLLNPVVNIAIGTAYLKKLFI